MDGGNILFELAECQGCFLFLLRIIPKQQKEQKSQNRNMIFNEIKKELRLKITKQVKGRQQQQTTARWVQKEVEFVRVRSLQRKPTKTLTDEGHIPPKYSAGLQVGPSLDYMQSHEAVEIEFTQEAKENKTTPCGNPKFYI